MPHTANKMNNIKEYGRLIYVEPNNNEIDNAYNNPEDLNFSVDLRVIIPDRNSYGKDYENELMMNSGSFFMGTPLHKELDKEGKILASGNFNLTDNYTNICISEYKDGHQSDRESFGINSIDIKFSPNFFPEVVINFTDIRGNSLMMPSEINQGGTKIYQNFFKYLFKFPYPRFLLSVKGYYGTEVTFALCVSDFKSNFNPSLGNFDVTVSFIGDMYGIYSDIPFSYLILAPYIDAIGAEPNEYWKHSNFTFKDGLPIPTFLEFIYKYENIADEIKEMLKYDNDYNLIDGILEERKKLKLLTKLNEAYLSYNKDNSDDIKSNSTNNMYLETSYYTIGVSNRSYVNFKHSVENFKNVYDEYVGIYGLISNKEYSIFRNNDIKPLKIDENGNITVETNNKANEVQFLEAKNFCNTNKNEEVYQFNLFVEKIKEKMISGNSLNYIILSKFNKEGEFADVLKNEIKLISNEITSKYKDGNISKEYASLLGKSLGFVPNIRNVFKMIFAHIDCFMHFFYEDLMGKIQKSAISKQRKSEVIGWDIANTDIKTADKNCDFPPFTEYYKQNNNYKRERTLPDANLDELTFVDKLLSAIYGLEDKIKKIEQAELNEEPITDTYETEYYDKDFNPTNICDLYVKQNPYGAFEISSDMKESVRELLLITLNRIALAIDTNPSFPNINKLIKSECNNFLSTVTNFNSSFLNELESACNLSDNDLIEYVSNGLNTEKLRYGLAINNNFFKINGDELPINPISIYKIYDENPKITNEIKNNFITLGQDEIEFVKNKYRRNLPIEPDFSIKEWDYSLNSFSKKFVGHIYFLENKIESADVALERALHAFELEKTDKKIERMVNSPERYLYKEKAYQTLLEEYNRRNDIVISFPIFQMYDGENIKNIFNDEGSEILKNDNIYVKALCFLSSLVGTTNISFIHKFLDSRIVETPLYIKLFLGSQVWWYHNCKELGFIKEDENPYFTIDKNGIFNNLKNSRNANSISGYNIKEISDICSDFENDFIKWANDNNGFKIIFNSILEFIKHHEFVKYDNVCNNPECFNVKETDYSEIGKILIEFYFKRETVIFVTSKTNSQNLQIHPNCLNKFIKCVIEKYKKNIESNENEIENFSYEEEGFHDESAEKETLREITYYTLKNLYDKWLCAYSFERFKIADEDNNDKQNNKYEFNKFVFMDSFYRDIGDLFIINANYLYNLIKDEINGNKNFGLLTVMSDMARENNLSFYPLPIKSAFYDRDYLGEMFKPHNLYNCVGKNREYGNTYVFIYSYPPAKTLNLDLDYGNSVEYDDNTLYLVDKNGEINKECGIIDSESMYTMPSFGVSYGVQNQSYFTNISVNMDSPSETEESVKNTFILSQKAKNGDTSTPASIGQDLYSIYSTRSYECTVEMLGCINIMPLMYFNLNNIPMFRGAYRIYNVEHHIEAGKMTTKFKGIKAAKGTLPYIDSSLNIENLLDRIRSIESSEDEVDIINGDINAEEMSEDNNIILDKEFNTNNGWETGNEISNRYKLFVRDIYEAANNPKFAQNFLNEARRQISTERGVKRYDTNSPLYINGIYNNIGSATSSYGGIGYCAMSVTMLLNEGFKRNAGYKLERIYVEHAKNAGKELEKRGFELIASSEKNIKKLEIPLSRAERRNWLNTYAKEGDIVVMARQKDSESGHIAILLGKDNEYWVSDYRQKKSNDAWVYGVEVPKFIRLYRYKGEVIGINGDITKSAISALPFSSSSITSGKLYLSQKGLDTLKGFETFNSKAYWDYGKYSIGYGHRGDEVKKDDIIDEQGAEKLLRQDVAKFEDLVRSYKSKVEGWDGWSQSEFDAMVLFAYNLGNIDGVTNNGQRTKSEIADSILLYYYAGGKPNEGLEKRRKKEREIFLNGY